MNLGEAGRLLCAGGLNQAQVGAERRPISARRRGRPGLLESALETDNPLWIRAVCVLVALLAWVMAIREALLLVKRRRQVPR